MQSNKNPYENWGLQLCSSCSLWPKFMLPLCIYFLDATKIAKSNGYLKLMVK